MEVWQTSNLRPLRLGEEKKEEEEERNRMKIYMVCPITLGDHKQTNRQTNTDKNIIILLSGGNKLRTAVVT